MPISMYPLESKPIGFNINIYPKEPVIYCIRNKNNGKIYIGQTIRFRKRLTEHRISLLNNRHCSLYLQKAFNKYGINNFEVEILELCSKKELYDREVYWIEKLNSTNKDIGYNYLVRASSPWYGPRSDKHKANLSKSLKGRIISDNEKNRLKKLNLGRFIGSKSPNAKSIIQYDISMNKIAEYDCISTAAKCMNISRKSISNNLNNRSKSSGGFIWKYNNK